MDEEPEVAQARNRPAEEPPSPRPIPITPDMLETPPEAPLDFETGMSAAPKVTLALILINIGVFLYITFTVAVIFMHRRALASRNRRVGSAIAACAAFSIIVGCLSPYVIGGFLGGIAMTVIIPVSIVARKMNPRKISA